MADLDMDHVVRRLVNSATPYRTCMTCRWRKGDYLGKAFSMCYHPLVEKSACSGKFCEIERMPRFDDINACTSAGLLWEPKPKGILCRLLELFR